MAAILPFREALNKGLASDTLVNTKIVLFPRRDSSSRVYGPKSLYASNHLLKSVPYFNNRDSVHSTFCAGFYRPSEGASTERRIGDDRSSELLGRSDN